MGYLDNMDWEKIKKELQSELEKGLAVIKNGVVVMQKKAEELTEEGKRQYKVLSTKAKIHNGMRDLGARVYTLMRGKRIKNPALDTEVGGMIARIKSLEADLAKLEGKADASPVRAVRKTRAAASTKARRHAAAASRRKARRRETGEP